MLNMDFTQSVLINTLTASWKTSPMTGVFRKPLAREDVEQGHATSIVRYDAGSKFRSHSHPLGEEILVLEGTFSDEEGDYPAGSYFRNPPGSSHAPYSTDGCLLLVKLHQFQEEDFNRLSIDSSVVWSAEYTGAMSLYEFGSERVWLVRVQNGENVLKQLDLSHAVEVFVISGDAQYNGQPLKEGTWLREPAFTVGRWSVPSHCLIWLKTGHF